MLREKQETSECWRLSHRWGKPIISTSYQENSEGILNNQTYYESLQLFEAKLKKIQNRIQFSALDFLYVDNL
jgi:hypothetical protein